MNLLKNIFGRKEVDSKDVFQLNFFLAYTFFPPAIESYNKGETSINDILNFIPFLKQKKSQWSHLYKLIKVTDSGLNSVGIRTIVIELPHNHPLAKAHILIVQQNEKLKNAQYYILEKEIIGNGYMLCSADSSGSHFNYGPVDSIPEMSKLVNDISFSEWEKTNEDKQTNKSQTNTDSSGETNQQQPVLNSITPPANRNDGIEDFIEQCWDLLEFASLHGKMKVAPFYNSNTGENFKTCAFVDENEKVILVGFSKNLGERTPAQIVQDKHILRVAKLKNGSYKLFKAKTAHLSVFSADWCRPSRDLLKSMQKHGISKYSLIDVDSQSDITDSFKINSIPAIIISDEEGEIIKKWFGYDEDDHQVLELQDYLKKTQFRIIPNPNGKNIADIAFEKALHLEHLLKAKYRENLGVNDDDLFLLCCASQMDFSPFKSFERLSSSFKLFFDKIYNYIYRKQSPCDWIRSFVGQNGASYAEDSEAWDYYDSCKIDIFEERFGRMSTAPNANGEIICFFIDDKNNITTANVGKYAVRFLSSNLVENKDKLIVYTKAGKPNKQGITISSYVVEVRDTSIYRAPKYVKEYIIQRLQFYSAILPYLASEKLPNYRLTTINLFTLMNDEAYNLTDNVLVEVHQDPKRFGLHDRHELYGYIIDEPKIEFLAAIKDIIFDAKIL